MTSTIVGNRGGIVFTVAALTDAGSSSTPAIYTLPNHIFRNLGPAGILVVTTSAASAGTVTGVNFVVNGQTLALTDATGDPITTLPQGKVLITFNKLSNTLNQL